MGRTNNRAARRAAQKTRHDPPSGVEQRRTLVESFALENIQVLEVLPEEDQQVDVAQVGLVMFGRPAFITRAGKVYSTFLSPEIAVQVGEAIAESGKTLAQRGPVATSSGLVLSGSMAEAEAVARQAEQAQALRGE